jgi:hypothetical protein
VSSTRPGPRDASLAKRSAPLWVEEVVVVLDGGDDLLRPLARFDAFDTGRVAHVRLVVLTYLGEHVCLHARRDDLQHRNVGFLQLASQRLREADHSGLGGRVDGGARKGDSRRCWRC